MSRPLATGSGSVPSTPTRKDERPGLALPADALQPAPPAPVALQVGAATRIVLVEADAEHGNFHALYGVRAIVNHRESAADYRLVLRR